MRKTVRVLLLLALAAALLMLPAAAAASGTVAESAVLIGDKVLTAGAIGTGYTFTRTEYPAQINSGTLVIHDGANLPAINVGTLVLTIRVEGSATVEEIDTDIRSQSGSYYPQSIEITGGGTLTVNDGISAGNGLGITGGTTVNVTSKSGSAIFVQNGSLNVYGSKLKATTQNDELAAITCMNVWKIEFSGSSTQVQVTGDKCKYGIDNYYYKGVGGTHEQSGPIKVLGGAYLEVSGKDYSIYGHRNDANTTFCELEIDESSSVKLISKADVTPDLPAAYEYTVAPGGSSSLAPYQGTPSFSGSYLEIRGRSGVFVPKMTRTPDQGSINIETEQTYTISPDESVAAPAGTAYSWTVNDAAQSASGNSFTFKSSTPDDYTVQCTVTVPIDGTTYSRVFTKPVSVTLIDASAAVVEAGSFIYYPLDEFAPVVRLNGQTLTHGTDYKVTATHPYTGTAELSGTLTQKPGNYDATITFMGSYSGTKAATLTIKKIPLSMANVTLTPASSPYNGTYQSPEITVSYKDLTFKQYEGFTQTDVFDYQIDWGKSDVYKLYPREYTITVEPVMDGLFVTDGGYLEGSTSRPFTITKATPDLSGNHVTITYGDDFVCPDTFTWNAPGNPNPITLKKDTDYLCEAAGPLGNAGDYQIGLTFPENHTFYTGSTYMMCTVEPKAIARTDIFLDDAAFTYDRENQMPLFDVKVKLGNDPDPTTLTNVKDYSITLTRDGSAVSQIKDVGVYTLMVEGVGNYTGKHNYTFTVNPRQLAPAEVTLDSDQLAWTGAIRKPTVSVVAQFPSLGNYALTEGTEYTVQWMKGSDYATAVSVTEDQLTQVGDYFAVIVGEGNYSGTVAVPFRIVQANTADGGADTYLGNEARNEFTFGQTITVRLQPQSDGTVARRSFRMAAPSAGDDTMTLYYGATQLTSPVGPDARGVYAADVTTMDVVRAAGLTTLPDSVTLTASFSGNGQLAGRTFDLPVLIHPAPLTVTYAAGLNRGYWPGNTAVSFTSFTFSGLLPGFEDVQATGLFEGNVDSDAIGMYTSAQFDLANLPLSGEHGQLYLAPVVFTAPTDVEIYGPPAIVAPTDKVYLTVLNGSSVVLQVEAEGQNLSYLWHKMENGVMTALTDGSDYTGTDAGTLRIVSAKPNSTIEYHCSVTNDAQPDPSGAPTVAVFVVTAVPAPPATGDASQPLLWAALACLSLMAMGMLRRRRA